MMLEEDSGEMMLEETLSTEETDKKIEVEEAADRKAREEADRKAKEEADRKVREEADRKAKEAADRKAREEADRKAKEETELKAREEVKPRPVSQAKAESNGKKGCMFLTVILAVIALGIFLFVKGCDSKQDASEISSTLIEDSSSKEYEDLESLIKQQVDDAEGSIEGLIEIEVNGKYGFANKDGKIITGKGPGACIEFGLKLAEILVSADAALNIKAGMQCK